MKILFDQNLSPRLAVELADVFPGSAHVRDRGFREAEDWEIWNFSASEGFVIASKDTDFRQHSVIKGHPPKVIIIAIGNCTTDRVESLLRSYQQELVEFESNTTLSLINLL